MSLLVRFFVYAILGWGMEIFWTGIGSLVRGNLRLTGHSYLWMFPIYGSAVLLERVHNAIRVWPWMARGLVWLGIIWGIELLTGWGIARLTGECPWDYRRSTSWTLGGYIRWDYAPAWFAVGLIFERVHDFLRLKIG